MNIKKVEQPNYRRIYTDIILKKFPDKEDKCEYILRKSSISFLDIIKLNELIFGSQDKETLRFNQSHRSYNRSSIFEILEYQEKNKLNNVQLARHFKLSRNTIAKWKKLFLVKPPFPNVEK